MSDLLASFERIVDAHPEPDLLSVLDSAGFLDALSALPLAEVEPLLRVLGARGIDAHVAETMVSRVTPAPGHALRAVLAAVQIAGGIERLLAMSIDHADTREQFGKPIGRFQAVQQQIAVLAEQAVLVRIAGQAACAHGLAPPSGAAAIAKSVASAAVPIATGIAHAVHGAIGITAAFPLARLSARLHQLRMAHGSESYWNGVLGASRLASPTFNTLDYIRTTR